MNKIKKIGVGFFAPLLVVAALCTAPAVAQLQPSAHEVPVVWGDADTLWPVPALENGCLLSLQVVGVTNAATVAVKHIIPYGSGGAVTNTVETAAANGTLYVYPADYVPYYVTNGVILTTSNLPPKPVWLVPGDFLLFTLSATNTAATVLPRVGVR
jgi:hypothetical protein